MDKKRNMTYNQQLKITIEQSTFLQHLFGSTVLITGATGMVGTCMIELFMTYNDLFGSKIHIIAMARNEQRMREVFSDYLGRENFSFIIGDVNDGISYPGNVDYLIHAASNTHPVAYAADPIGTIQTNVIGLKNLLDYAVEKKATRTVFLSSVEIYGENRGDVERFTEEYCGYIDCNTLRAGYPEGKRVGEALCQAYRKQYGLEVVIPRLSRLYGPTMLLSDTKAISQFIKKAAAGEDIVLKSKGNQLYSYTYVLDAVSAILLILCKGTDGEAYNISDVKSEITLKNLAEMLAEMGHTKVVFDLPEESERQGYSTATKALMDVGKTEALGWKPITHIKEGLQITLHEHELLHK